MWYKRGRYWYTQSGGPGSPHEMRSCASCGSPFFARRHRASPTQGHFCSIGCSKTGENHHHWAGDQVGYMGAHKRVYLARGKADSCSVTDCDSGCRVFQWANLTGDYANVDDYAPMCQSHHQRYDAARRRATGGFTAPNTPRLLAAAAASL